MVSSLPQLSRNRRSTSVRRTGADIRGGLGMQTDWYQLEIEDVFRMVGSSESGLSSVEAGKRLLELGPNRLVEEEKVSRGRTLVHQFGNPWVYLLLMAAALCFFIGGYRDGGTLLAAALLLVGISYLQEHKAEEDLAFLEKIAGTRARVLRKRWRLKLLA
jgi:P-type Ca2+ transporter type 2C